MAYLRMAGITKFFPGVVANSNVDFEVEEGEIHALVGENGAGKTHADEDPVRPGEARRRARFSCSGQPVTIPNPQAAIELGIGMVHQHFMLVRRSPSPRMSPWATSRAGAVRRPARR